MSGEVPNTWQSKTVGDLFCVNTSGHWGDEPDGDGDGNILVLRSTNFRKTGGLIYETAATRQFDQKKLVQKRLQPGDIILERSGGSPAQPVGRTRRFEADGCYSASNFMQIMRPSPQVDQRFTSYLLDFIYDQGLTEPLQKATTGIRNLDFKTYLELPVALPPLDEQRRITEVLMSLDEALHAAYDVVEQCEQVLELECPASALMGPNRLN
jgi:type I restriction enzyme S subunit